jgi:Immunity protein 74
MAERFWKPRTNVVESSAGFSVEVLGRTGMLYVEKGHSLHLYSEVLAIPHAVAIWRDSIKGWDPPNDAEPISDKDREQIIQNIQRAFEETKQRLDVI